MMEADTMPTAGLEALVAEIVSSYLAKNQVAPSDLSQLITTVYQSLHSLGTAPEPEPPRTPAVSVRQSVTTDYVVCLECGWRGSTLRRHIGARHGLDESAYRQRWNLRPDHALVAPGYSAKRSELARQIGLGRLGRGGDSLNTADQADALSGQAQGC
jgi:predicted transcriptional regulator